MLVLRCLAGNVHSRQSRAGWRPRRRIGVRYPGAIARAGTTSPRPDRLGHVSPPPPGHQRRVLNPHLRRAPDYLLPDHRRRPRTLGAPNRSAGSSPPTRASSAPARSCARPIPRRPRRHPATDYPTGRHHRTRRGRPSPTQGVRPRREARARGTPGPHPPQHITPSARWPTGPGRLRRDEPARGVPGLGQRIFRSHAYDPGRALRNTVWIHGIGAAPTTPRYDRQALYGSSAAARLDRRRFRRRFPGLTPRNALTVILRARVKLSQKSLRLFEVECCSQTL